MADEETKEVKVTYQGKDIDGYFKDEEEISNAFNAVQNRWYKYENFESKEGYEECIKVLKLIEHSIIAHGIFSPNEPLKEI
mmetsp:Transcript_10037/g.8560  ORF Transcript_10037/g.8560 Transcript_10037/m.8560 type:complete len:81 (+) Transcript_10037:37-279(+)